MNRAIQASIAACFNHWLTATSQVDTGCIIMQTPETMNAHAVRMPNWRPNLDLVVLAQLRHAITKQDM